MSAMRGPAALPTLGAFALGALALGVGVFGGLDTTLAAMRPSAAARPSWTSGTFVYADLCTASDGNLAGRRITVRRSPNGDGVTYETAAGALGTPQSADALSFDDERRELTFTVEGEAGLVSFHGIAAPDLLSGTIVDASGQHPLRLRRTLRSREGEECRGLMPQGTPQDPQTTASTD